MYGIFSVMLAMLLYIFIASYMDKSEHRFCKQVAFQHVILCPEVPIQMSWWTIECQQVLEYNIHDYNLCMEQANKNHTK